MTVKHIEKIKGVANKNVDCQYMWTDLKAPQSNIKSNLLLICNMILKGVGIFKNTGIITKK